MERPPRSRSCARRLTTESTEDTEKNGAVEGGDARRETRDARGVIPRTPSKGCWQRIPPWRDRRRVRCSPSAGALLAGTRLPPPRSEGHAPPEGSAVALNRHPRISSRLLVTPFRSPSRWPYTNAITEVRSPGLSHGEGTWGGFKPCLGRGPSPKRQNHAWTRRSQRRKRSDTTCAPRFRIPRRPLRRRVSPFPVAAVGAAPVKGPRGIPHPASSCAGGAVRPSEMAPQRAWEPFPRFSAGRGPLRGPLPTPVLGISIRQRTFRGTGGLCPPVFMPWR